MDPADRARDELMNAILERASSDHAFRQALLTDPRTAIRESFHVEIPPAFRIRFVEKPADVDALIVLPDERVDGELSEADLESVAGGFTAAHQWAPPPFTGRA